MKQAAAYTLNEDGEEQFFVLLECGCSLHVAPLTLFDQDIPCPLHEESRFYGDREPHVET